MREFYHIVDVRVLVLRLNKYFEHLNGVTTRSSSSAKLVVLQTMLPFVLLLCLKHSLSL